MSLREEQGVIGAILIDPDYSLKYAVNFLKPEMFQVELYGETYRSMLATYDKGEQISIAIIAQDLECDKWSSDYLASEYSACLGNCESSALIKSYAVAVVKSYKSRMLKGLMEKISIEPKSIEDSIATILTTCENLQNSRQSTSKSLKQIVAENKDNYFKDIDKHLIKTGFWALDECIGGLEGGDVTVIGARPAVGKSAYVTQIIGQVAHKGYKVGYYNLEMNESQVYERFVSRLAELSLIRVRRAKAFLSNEEERFTRANEVLSGYNVIISTGSKTVSEIRMESRYQKFDLIVIDYLQLIKSGKSYANRASEVGEISKSIKALAMELHVPIILLSQLNRTSEQSQTKEPTMADLRESGDIEQDASNIILLWNVSEDHKHKGLKVDKCRQGELTKIGLSFDGEHMAFSEAKGDFKAFIGNIKRQEKDAQDLNEYCNADDDIPWE